MSPDEIRVGGKVCFFCTLLQSINKKSPLEIVKGFKRVRFVGWAGLKAI
jgi:hypothetical protein